MVREGAVYSRSNKPIPNKAVQAKFSTYEHFDGELIFGDPTSKTCYRDTVSVETPWGAVRIKRALDAARRPRRGQPEFEDCRRAADAAGKTVDEVRQAARESYSRRGDGADKDRE